MPTVRSKKDSSADTLSLVPGIGQESLGVFGALALLWTFSWQLFVFLPFRAVITHLYDRLFRPTGRAFVGNAVAKLFQWILSRTSTAQTRVFFGENAFRLADAKAAWQGKLEWISHVAADGVKGRWIARPGVQRSKEDIVVYYVHGGGGVVDTGPSAQEFFLQLLDRLEKKEGIKAAVFALDYHLAPEYKYPSQLIEVLAGYHWLTSSVPPSKILLAGDSFGGNVVSAFLLHLARPAKEIKVPTSFGPTPSKPAGVLLVSPEVKFGSLSPSYKKNLLSDILTPGSMVRGGFDYIGARLPFTHRFRTRWVVLNPLWQLIDPQRMPPVPVERLAGHAGWLGWDKIEGIERFQDPLVQPGLVKDCDWLSEAFPGEGKTLVAWGGVEILSDDIEAFHYQLEKAGIKPRKLYKPFGIHNFVFLDYVIPTSWRSKSKGAEGKYDFGLNGVLEFIRDVAVDGKNKVEQEKKPEQDTATTTALDGKEEQQEIKKLKEEHKPAKPQPPPAPKPVAPPTAGLSFANAAASTDRVSQNAPVVATGEGKTLEAHLDDGKLVAEKQTAKHDEASLPPIPTPAPVRNAAPQEPSVDLARPSAVDALKAAQAQEEAKRAPPKKKKKAKKPVAPVPAPENGGSYAAAANSKAEADDSAVVAKGEGDILTAHLDDGNLVPEVAQSKAAAAGQPGSGNGGSWAGVAASTTDVDADAPIVASGEGQVLVASLDNGALHAEQK
ncbi:hypothetical protein JCM10213_001735 [Rhodosporidiobolus nylandii]